jgi:amino acid adenylation domain-containing protein
MNNYLVHQLLAESANKYPDRIAVRFKDSSLTYSALEMKSNRLAASLIEKGIKKGDRAGILLSKSPESLIALFGIMKTGAIYVPLDPLSPPQRITQIIVRCGIEYLVASCEVFRRVCSSDNTGPLKHVILTGPDAPGETECFPLEACHPWNTIMDVPSNGFQPVEGADTDPAYILHTSGSTGVPKGVVISHLNAVAFVNMAVDFFGINEGDRVASHAPIHFDLSVFDIFGAIKSGSTIVLVPELLSTFPAKMAEFIDHERITVWNSVSSVLTLLADRGKLDRFCYSALRLVHFSGDIMPIKYLRILKSNMKAAEFYNIYGQTEANSSLCFKVSDIAVCDSWKIPIGKPFPNFNVFALNEGGEEIRKPGEEGELYIDSSTVALGYWNEDSMTREKFVDDPRQGCFKKHVYRTGDMVRISDGGNFIFVGRNDHMIKCRGYRVEILEIEIVLAGHPNISQAIVLAVPDEVLGNRIIALISPIDGVEISVDQIAEYCHKNLPRYMVPEEFQIVDKLLRTATGKVDRKLMKESYFSDMLKGKINGPSLHSEMKSPQ